MATPLKGVAPLTERLSVFPITKKTGALFPPTSTSYKIHPLIREFLQTKLNESEDKSNYIQSFCAKMIEIGKTIPQITTLEIINEVKNAIPHLAEVAENHLDAVSNKNLLWAFFGLGNFYKGQGLYALAEPWYEKYVELV